MLYTQNVIRKNITCKTAQNVIRKKTKSKGKLVIVKTRKEINIYLEMILIFLIHIHECQTVDVFPTIKERNLFLKFISVKNRNEHVKPFDNSKKHVKMKINKRNKTS